MRRRSDASSSRCSCPQLEQCCKTVSKSRSVLAQDMKLQPEGARRRLQVSRQGLGTGVGRVDEERNDGRRGHQLMQQFQPLRSHLDGQRGDACEVDIARRGWHGRKVPTAVILSRTIRPAPEIVTGRGAT